MPAVNLNDLLAKIGPALADITRQLTTAAQLAATADARLVAFGLGSDEETILAACDLADRAAHLEEFRRHLAGQAATFPWFEPAWPIPEVPDPYDDGHDDRTTDEV